MNKDAPIVTFTPPVKKTLLLKRASLIKFRRLYDYQVRSFGNLKGMSLWLSSSYEWKIVKDECGKTCLIALKGE